MGKRDDIALALTRQSFSDVPNWRGRILDYQLAPGRNPPELMAQKYESMPVSTNIEDRRNQSDLERLSLQWLGHSPEVIADVFRHPLTRLDNLDTVKRQQVPDFLDPNNLALAGDAGLFSVGREGPF